MMFLQLGGCFVCRLLSALYGKGAWCSNYGAGPRRSVLFLWEITLSLGLLGAKGTVFQRRLFVYSEKGVLSKSVVMVVQLVC